MDPNLALFAQMAQAGQGGRIPGDASKILANLPKPAGNPQPQLPPPPGGMPGMPGMGGGAPPGGVNVNVNAPGGQPPGPPPVPGMEPPGGMPGMPGQIPEGPQAGQSAMPPPGLPPSPLEAMGIGARATPQMPPGMLPQGATPPISAEKATQALALARQGRFGDDRMVHAQPGDMVVPPSVQSQNPGLAAALQHAFANQGVNPASRMVGGQPNINPITGQEEFFDMGSILPMLLPIALTALLGPAGIAAAAPLMGAEMAGIAVPALLGGVGTFGGSLLRGQPVGTAALQGLAGAAGSGLGSWVGGGGLSGALGGAGGSPLTSGQQGLLNDMNAFAPPGAAVPQGFTSAVPELTAAESAAASIRDPIGMEKLAGGGLDAMGKPIEKTFLQRAFSGQNIGGALGGMLGASLIPDKVKEAVADLGPHLSQTPRPLSDFVGGQPSMARMPTAEELSRYGRGPAYSFFG
jgi:hypothetical protein